MKAKQKRTTWGCLGGAILVAVLLGGGVAAQEKAVEQKVGDEKAAEAQPAPTAPPKQDEIMTLKRRVAGFWQARLKRDFRAQWEYVEPREKGRTTPEEYGHGKGVVQYLAYQVEDAVINGSFATVQVRVLVRPNHPFLAQSRIGPQANVLADRWIRVEGVWYRLDKPGPEAEPGPQADAPRAQ